MALLRLKYVRREVSLTVNGEMMSKTKILLLTNRDSDNIGDLVIEATVISLLKGAMKNLGVSAADFSIESRAAGIISKKYMKTGDPALLESARTAISGADVLVFGGAPLFNYAYQDFYLRTIKTLELAEEYGVPVIFSSIGVEPFDASNPKCLQLKEALALPCVRQITTRDDFESVKSYAEGTDTPVAHVSDPAVFADAIFRKKPATAKPKPQGEPAQPLSFAKRAFRKLPLPVKTKHQLRMALRRVLGSPGLPSSEQRVVPATVEKTPLAVPPAEENPGKRQRIGLIVTRAGIFKDNGIEFTEEQQRQFWLETKAKLEGLGYECRFFTTGHFSDEVFLDAMVRENGIPGSEANIIVVSPEDLIDELKACDGVIAYRLHASITSFALGVPSVGLSWNFKVPYFYESVGYGERALEPERWTADEVVPVLQRAMEEGVVKDEKFLASVYDTLFSALKTVVAPEVDVQPYTFAQLQTKLPPYPGTTSKQYRAKYNTKIRRTYDNYQKLSLKLEKALSRKG